MFSGTALHPCDLQVQPAPESWSQYTGRADTLWFTSDASFQLSYFSEIRIRNKFNWEKKRILFRSEERVKSVRLVPARLLCKALLFTQIQYTAKTDIARLQCVCVCFFLLQQFCNNSKLFCSIVIVHMCVFLFLLLLLLCRQTLCGELIWRNDDSSESVRHGEDVVSTLLLRSIFSRTNYNRCSKPEINARASKTKLLAFFLSFVAFIEMN